MVLSNQSSHTTVDETLSAIGARLHQLRVRKLLTQADLAEKADVSLRTIRNIEQGGNGTLESLVRLLRALDAMPQLDALLPPPRFSPMAVLKSASLPKRVRKSRSS